VVKIITLVPQTEQPSARNRGRAKGVAAAVRQPPHQIEIFKNTDLADTMISTFYVIYPSAKISH
jgi:hypothetical protein